MGALWCFSVDFICDTDTHMRTDSIYVNCRSVLNAKA